MTCEQLRDLAELHLMELLDPAEESALRSHLEAGCPRCAAAVASARESLHMLPFALPPQQPSDMAKARLMAAIKAEAARPAAGSRQAVPSPRPGAAMAWGRLAAASVAAAIFGGVLTSTVLTRRHTARMAEMSAQLTRTQTDLDKARGELQRRNDVIIMAQASRVIDLAGQGASAQITGRVFWDERQNAWRLLADAFPKAPEGRSWQLWAITDKGDKISAGVFADASAGAAAGSIQVPPGAGSVAAWAVTDEPAGGSPQPTGSIHLIGKV